jgi:hydroxymethylpyrimidine pyrophosphatase-like HAD family hydrolase
LRNREVTEEWLISKEDQIEVARRMRSAIPQISFAIETHDYYHREKSYIPRWDIGLDNVGVEKIEDAAKGPIFKMLARCSGGELTSDEMLEVALKELDGLVTVTHSNPVESLLEISALGISKGTTLAKVAARLGIDAADCVSFGDNPNDFPMLQWCGRSYAMADGHPDGIKYATDVAQSHHLDGVAMVIEKLLDLPA